MLFSDLFVQALNKIGIESIKSSIFFIIKILLYANIGFFYSNIYTSIHLSNIFFVLLYILHNEAGINNLLCFL